ncbi:MAG TPA: hypothetical protein VFX70_20325 [Mycobacteriales bacterium]|nr:hypothetical protein [Mycobacteriales bacterium]
MSDEGMFRPPGAPGADLQRVQAPGSPVPRSPAGNPAGPDGPPGAGTSRPPEDRDGEPDVRRRLAPQTGWRLAGVGLAVVLYLAAGLPWYRIGVDQCAREFGQNDSAALRAACANVALDGWQVSRWGTLLALAAGAVMLLRLARRGPVALDLLAPLAAGLAGVLAVRAMFDPADRQLDLTWPGPLAVLPLLGALAVAGAQAYRFEHLSGVGSVGQAGQRLAAHLADHPLRVPGWLRPASVWRRRRRWLVGAGVVFVAVVARGCAQQAPLGGTAGIPGVTDARAGGGPGHGPVGRTSASEAPGTAGGGRPARPSPVPDGVRLLASARQAVAAARTVSVHLDSVAGADVVVDLRMTSNRDADGTVTTAHNGYNVRRVGTQCWVQHLVGHPLLAWVPTCTIPATSGSPAFDLAALTDWRVMVTALPDPAGARTAAGRTDSGGWRVNAADGTAVYLPGGTTAGGLPVRVDGARARRGGATNVRYSAWNEPVTITPP